MKKFIILFLCFSFNLFSVEFTIVNKTNLKLQPFLTHVKIKGSLPDGTKIDTYSAPGYIHKGQIVYINPGESIIIKLNPETRNNLTLDFSKANNFYLKAIHQLDSDLIEIKDHAVYIVTHNKNAASNLDVKTYVLKIPYVNSESSISTLATLDDEEQEKKDLEIADAFLK